MNTPDGLPIGYLFSPEDHELIIDFLTKKINNHNLPCNKIRDINVYGFTPDQLFGMYKTGGEAECYYFTQREKKHEGGSRPNRRVVLGDGKEVGFWKQTSSPYDVFHKEKQVGFKRTYNYYECESKDVKTNWIMQEYILLSPSAPRQTVENKMKFDDWVVCKIYKKKENNKQSKECPTSQDNVEQQVGAIHQINQHNIVVQGGRTFQASVPFESSSLINGGGLDGQVAQLSRLPHNGLFEKNQEIGRKRSAPDDDSMFYDEIYKAFEQVLDDDDDDDDHDVHNSNKIRRISPEESSLTNYPTDEPHRHNEVVRYGFASIPSGLDFGTTQFAVNYGFPASTSMIQQQTNVEDGTVQSLNPENISFNWPMTTHVSMGTSTMERECNIMDQNITSQDFSLIPTEAAVDQNKSDDTSGSKKDAEEDYMDLADLPLDEIDATGELGVYTDQAGAPLDLSSWFNFVDDGLKEHHDSSFGLEIPMDDLSEIPWGLLA